MTDHPSPVAEVQRSLDLAKEAATAIEKGQLAEAVIDLARSLGALRLAVVGLIEESEGRKK